IAKPEWWQGRSTSMDTQIPAAAQRSDSPTPYARRLLVAATAAALILNFIPGAEIAFYPLRLFATFVHEGGHALATILTGGSVESIALARDGSGVTLSRGGFLPLIYSAGYLGTAAIGALALLMSRRRGA